MDMRAKKVLAVASGGGHWVELRRLRPAWSQCVVAYVTTLREYEVELRDDPPCPGGIQPRFFTVVDANQWTKLRSLWQAIMVTVIVLRFRPDVVVSTGAAPGYFAIRIGKLIRARAVWVDSIANADEVTLSGRMAGRHCDLFLTQWEHLAKPGGPHFRGRVL
jgi:UDP-N-acetylglucosamine:LPS N-acetylglucosamine transferase